MTIDTNSVPTQRASVDAAELEGGVKIWLTIQGETSHTTMAWRAPSWDALAETIDTTPSSEVAALLSRAEAAERERDVALAQARYIAKALEAAANHRDEALAREAALREVLDRWYRTGCPDCRGDCGSANPRFTLCLVRETDAALTNTPAAAAARDAALVERGRREGIEEAARVVEDDMTRRGERLWDHDYLAGRIAEAIRALATPPAEGGPDAR
jgi:hypothetical protein